jgi:hypothetical protein
MTPNDFTAALRSELHFRNTPFDGAALEAFAASVYPLVDDEPDVGRWADEFLMNQLPLLVESVAEGMRV